MTLTRQDFGRYRMSLRWWRRNLLDPIPPMGVAFAQAGDRVGSMPQLDFTEGSEPILARRWIWFSFERGRQYYFLVRCLAILARSAE